MNIIFRGEHTSAELMESMYSVLKLLSEKYKVKNFSSIDLHLKLLDSEQHDVELVDIKTFEPIAIFEVYKSANDADADQNSSNLTLVVDNTRPDK